MPLQLVPLFLQEEILTYTFASINVILIVITKNVQVISLFWTFFIYFISLCSVWNFANHLGIGHLRKGSNFAFIIFFLIFGAILFTQVTETIKSAAAITLFFYILSLKIKGKSGLIVYSLLFLCIGIHAQAIMLIPILYFRQCNTNTLIIILSIILIIAPFFNIIAIASTLLAALGGWFSLLFERMFFYSYDLANNTSIRYVGTGIMLFITSLYLYYCHTFKSNYKILNINLLYLIIMFLNFTVSDAFIRFANFSTFISTICILGLMRGKRNILYFSIFTIIICILNLQMTLGRTIGNGYTSSYMDNSITKIITSPVSDYLSFKVQ